MQKKEAIFPEGLPLPRVAYSPAVKAGPFVFISGQLGSDFVTGIPPEATINPNFPHHGSNIERQAAYIANNLNLTLEASGSSLEQCLSFTLYHTDAGELHDAAQVLHSTFGANGVPPHTTVLVEELPVANCSLEVDLVGLVAEPGERAEVIQPAGLPTPAVAGLPGTPLYQYGVKAGAFVMTAGLTATDFSAGVAPKAQVDPAFPYYAEAARLQTEYVLETQQAVLQAAGASLADVVKAELYLTDVRDFYRVEQIWKKYFPIDPPARTTVPVTDLGIPGLRIAMNLIAYVADDGAPKRTIHTDAAPRPLGHEPQAVQAGSMLFFSGQMATDYQAGLPPEVRINPSFPFHASAAEKQVNYIVNNIDAICQAAGTSRDLLVRRRGFYTDFTEFFTSFATWEKSFPSDPPASTTVRVPGPLLVPDCKVVIDLIALIPDA